MPITTAVEAPWPRSEPSTLTPGVEQTQLREAIRGLLTKWSGIEQVRAAAETAVGYSPDLWRRLVEDMSITALAVPEDRGGLGYGMVEFGIILEECGRNLVCEPVYTSAVVGMSALLAATADDISDLLGNVLEGTMIATATSLTPATDDVQASEAGDAWTLTGMATHVLGGVGADVVILSANTASGRRLFVTTAGDHLVPSEREVIDPTRRQADLTLRQAPALALTTAADHDQVCTQLLDLATLALACENTGIVDALLEMTVQYVQTRHQFGRPIGSFQAIKHRLADVLVELERARSACRYAAAVYDEDPATARLAIAVAGSVCTDAALYAAAETVQLHGGVGFTWEHPAHSYFRRAMGNEALQGDSRVHRARIASLIGI
ncbi:acyl-CoA dehydrogenase family protein [Rhodococcus sp. USK13]|uniref:acyl-CoA dehydrogenase family protein n=1 Tax=Rhodococcus sp. USK13 TaxID=2806442 RepID=UPI001BCEA4BB|nr:acyl-CoA dehydrogenase family protein [Rhodococcus sp. USK13]